MLYVMQIQIDILRDYGAVIFNWATLNFREDINSTRIIYEHGGTEGGDTYLIPFSWEIPRLTKFPGFQSRYTFLSKDTSTVHAP